jgi:hypothetical protein
MSWLFSQALVEAFSEATCSGGAPCAQLNVMPTEHPFLRRGKTTDSLPPSPSGLTYAALTADRGGALLTWYLAASRALTSAQQEKAPESTATPQASGSRWPGSWVRWSPASSSWKTAQCSLIEDSAPFSGPWPRWGSMRAGECSELPRLVSTTTGSGCGLRLPTPSGVNGGRNNMMGRVDEWGGSSNPLRGTVIGSMCLPEFEEMVMGWPIGWTAPTAYETARFRRWLQLHGKY